MTLLTWPIGDSRLRSWPVLAVDAGRVIRWVDGLPVLAQAGLPGM